MGGGNSKWDPALWRKPGATHSSPLCLPSRQEVWLKAISFHSYKCKTGEKWQWCRVPCRQNGPSFPLSFRKRQLKRKNRSWKPWNLFAFYLLIYLYPGSASVVPMPNLMAACLIIKFYWHTAPPIYFITAPHYNGRNEHCQQSLKYLPSGPWKKKFANSLFTCREWGTENATRHQTDYTWIISSNLQW